MRSAYLICASARTGSNLLATTIRHASVAGYPLEYFCPATFNTPYMLRVVGLPMEEADKGFNLAERIDRIASVGTTPNGIFGATVHWGYFRHLVAALGEREGREVLPLNGGLEALRSYFPGIRFIWLRRENHVAQAISHYLAKTTNRWQVQSREPLPDEQDNGPSYDFEAIKRFVVQAEREDKGWRAFFAGVDSDDIFPIAYEDLAADHEAVVSRALAFLGVPRQADAIPAAPLRRQATDRSLEWERRFRAELAATTQMPAAATA